MFIFFYLFFFINIILIFFFFLKKKIADLLKTHVNMQKMRRTMAVGTVASLGAVPNGLPSLALITRHSLNTIKEFYDMFATVREGIVASKLVACSVFGVRESSFRSLDFETIAAPYIAKLQQPMEEEDPNAVQALASLTAALKDRN